MSKNNPAFVDEIGVVERIRSEITYVRISKKKDCNGCKACGFGDKDSVLMPAKSSISCKIGDSVCVKIPLQNGAKSSLYLWIFPILLLISCVFVGYFFGGDPYALVGAVVGLALGAAVWFAAEAVNRRRGVFPVITAVLTNNGDQ